MKRLKNKYRFVILSDKNFEEKISFALKGTNVITFLSILIFVVFVLIFLLFAFTPMKYYLPGYSSQGQSQEVHQLAMKVDSLTRSLKAREAYLKNIRNVLKGKVGDSTGGYQKTETGDPSPSMEKTEQSFNLDSAVASDTLSVELGNEEDIGKLDNYRKAGNLSDLDYQSFFPPVKGAITEGFNEGDNHYAIDVAGPSDQGIKAVKDGYVVFTGWSEETGNVIILQHQNNLLSVYKHNAELLKKNGNFVKAGEPIAIIGTSGSLSTGPHLHFELWHHGKPVDPEKYIKF